MKQRILFPVLFIFMGCSAPSESEQNQLESGDVFRNDYAEAFRIAKFDDYTQISVINPDTEELDFEYVIGASKKSTGQIELPGNASRVIALSATHIGMIEKLGLTTRIVGVSSADYVYSQNVLTQIEQSKTFSLGDIGSSDVEGYVAVRPDLIITSGFDNNAPILKKMKSAGLTLFTNYDWKETHPLGRAEWIKVFGVIFNQEQQANKLFEEICKAYQATAEKVAAQEKKVNVLVGTMYGDIFNAPAGESYMAKLLEDANVNYVYSDSKGVGSLSLTLEEVISGNRTTQFWLNPAAQNTEQLMQMNTRFELLECVQNGNVYSYYEDVNKFWEESIIKPELVIQDLCKIVYPDLFQGEEFTFYSVLKP